MANILSLIIGAIALVGAVIGFIPLLGWLNWFVAPIALIGAAVGIASRQQAGRNLNLFVLFVCVVRLMLGGGII